MKLTVSFRNSAKEPKNISNLLMCMSPSLGFYERCSDIYRRSKYAMGEGRIFVDSYSVNYTQSNKERPT